MIEFTVPGEPRGKARPRVVRTRAGRSVSYTPDRTVAYEELVRQRFRQQWPKEELPFPDKQPDVDNIVKIVLDALNGLAWHDDAQVTFLAVSKEYTGKEPFVAVTLN